MIDRHQELDAVSSTYNHDAIRTRPLLGSVAVLAVVCVQPLQADDLPLREFFPARFGSYQLAPAEEPAAPLARTPEPLLRYGDPVRTFLRGGELFLWLDGKRPVAAAAFWMDLIGPTCVREFALLAPQSVAASHGDVQDLWTPDAARLHIRPVPGGESIAATPALRLGQMRSIARRFSSTYYRRSDGESFPLSLLPQPVYRFSEPDAGIADGALFALVEANDPDVLLLITAEPDPSGRTVWHYTLGRLNSNRVVVHLDGADVWEAADYWNNPRRKTDLYLEAADDPDVLPAAPAQAPGSKPTE